MQNEKTAIIYARVSTARQADDGLPVESQIEQCRVKAEALGARVLKVFRDDGISGRTSRRPAFQEAIDYCERQGVALFVCWSTSRFARNRLDAALHKRLLEKIGTRLVYASQDFGEGDDGWLAEAIIEVMDEQYSRNIAKDTRRSMAKNAVDGFWNGGHLPYGFQAIPAGKRRRLAVQEGESTIVRLIFQWYLEGAGCKDIALRLNGAGMSRRGIPWNKARVRAVIASPAVVGRTEWTDRGQAIATQSHPPIIELEDYHMAQQTMKDRIPANVGGRPRSEAVFSGILRCGACGQAMMTETATGRGGNRYHYYNCRSHLKGMGCASRRVPVDAVDNALLRAILDQVFTPQNLRAFVADLKTQTSQFERDRQAKIDAAAAELADVDRRLRRQYESIEAGTGLNLADVATRIRELKARKEALTRAAEEAAAELPPPVSITEQDAVHAADLLRGMVESCEDAPTLRKFMETVVKQATLLGDQITLDYLPDSIVMAVSGSQCAVRWLPDSSKMRTVRIYVKLRRNAA